MDTLTAGIWQTGSQPLMLFAPGMGTLPTTMRQELRRKRKIVQIRDRRRELSEPRTCCFLLMALIFQIGVFGSIPGFTVLSQKS